MSQHLPSPYVFLSYTSSERPRAVGIADALEASGISVWIDREAIAGGTSWSREIVEGIEHCAVLVVCCTPKAMQSRNVKQEIQLAWRYEKPYLPLLLEPVDFPQQVLYFLEGWQWVEAGGAQERWLPAVLRALKRLGIDRASTPQQPTAEARDVSRPLEPPNRAAHIQSGPSPSPAGPVEAPLSQDVETQRGRERGTKAGSSPSSALSDAPSARVPSIGGQGAPPFVGRERERTTLRQALDEAIAGRGRLMLLAGEPGIGKTRLAEQLVAEARYRGSLVLWGRCWEGDGAPAYFPWAEAVRSYLREVETRTAISAFGSAAGEIAQLMPDLYAFLPEMPALPPLSDPEQARFRLFGAVVDWLRRVAQRQPLVLVLDDLHWADKPSLLLLQYFARELGRLPVLVLGTYRDTDLDRSHPLAEVLAGLRREPVHERLLVRGLSEAETEALVAATAQQELGPAGRALAAALHRETEGNPFFLQQTLRHLIDSGKLIRDADRWTSTVESVAALGIPEGVREVIGRRLARLSEPCNQLLGVAAVIGREFAVRTLERVSDRGEDELLDLLEEAQAARLIGEGSGSRNAFRFSHALVRETLYGELSTLRRTRLHRRVAQAMETRRPEEHAAELAYHYSQAGEACITQALRYSRLAAEQAEARVAWEEAVRQYERCLALLADAEERPDVDDAALLTAVGRCDRNAGEHHSAWGSLMRAITLYRDRGDGLGLARTALQATLIPLSVQRLRPLLREALAALGDREPHLEARLLLIPLLDEAQDWMMGDVAQLESRVRVVAEQHGFTDVRALLHVHAGLRLAQRQEFDAALTQVRTGVEELAALGRAAESARFRWNVSMLALLRGDLAAGEAVTRDGLRYVRQVHARHHEDTLLGLLVGLAWARADWAGCAAILAEIRDDSLVANMRRAVLPELRGIEQAQELMPNPEEMGGFGFGHWPVSAIAGRARVRFLAGDEAGAQGELVVWHEEMARLGGKVLDSVLLQYHHLWADEAFSALAPEADVQAAYERYTGWRAVRYEPATGRSFDRFTGALALRLDLVDAAERHFRTGLEWTEREGCPIEHGRCLQGLAVVAARRWQPDEARRLLDRAAALFERHNTVLFLRQVQTAREQLPA